MEQIAVPRQPFYAIAELRQVALAEFDLIIHGETPPANVEELNNAMRGVFAGTTLTGDTGGLYAGFSHYVEKYGGGYYSYVVADYWSRQLYPVVRENCREFARKVLMPVAPAREKLSAFMQF
jgi:Zn-dependent oligopeptidase